MAGLLYNNNFSATGELTWTPQKSGYYHVLIDANGNATFGTAGAVTVAQRGISFEDLTAIEAPIRKIVHFLGGSAVSFTLTASGGTPDLDIVVMPVV